MTMEKRFGRFFWTAGWLAVVAVTGGGLEAHAEPSGRVPGLPEDALRRTISIVKQGQEASGFSASGPEIRFFFRLRVDRLVTAARLQLSTTSQKEGTLDIEVSINGSTAGRIGLRAGQAEVLDIDPSLLSDENVLALSRPGADPCGSAGKELLRVFKTAELELQQTALPIAKDLASLPLPFFDPLVEEPVTIQVALLGERTLEMARAAGLVAGYFGLQGGSRLRFAVFFDELPDGNAVVFASGQSEFTAGLIEDDGPAVSVVDHPDDAGKTARLLLFTAATPGELLGVAQQFSKGNIDRGGVLPANQSDYRPYEAPRWVENGREIRLGDLTDGAGLVLEGEKEVTQAVSFRLAPDIFAELSRPVPLVIDYRVSVPPGSVPPEVVVELNHRVIGRLEVPGPAQRPRSQRARFDIHPSLLSGYNKLRLHADFSPDGKGCEPSGPVLPRVEIEESSALHVENLHHFAVMPDVKLFVYDGFPFTRFADLRETAVLLSPQPHPQEFSLLFSALAHFSAITGELPGRAVFANSESTYEKAGRDRDLLVVAGGPWHPWLQSHADRLPFAYTPGGLAPRLPFRPGVLLNYLTGFAAFVQLPQARRFAQTVSPVLGVAGVESPWAAKRGAVLLLATENSQAPALADAMGHAEASLGGGDLLLAGSDRRGAFVLGPRTTRGEMPLWRRERWFVATHWILLFPMMIVPALFLVRWSARALELIAQRRLQPPRRR